MTDNQQLSFIESDDKTQKLIAYYYDIKIVPDEDVDDRVNFIIRCEGEEHLEKIKNFFNTKGRNITSDKALEVICI